MAQRTPIRPVVAHRASPVTVGPSRRRGLRGIVLLCVAGLCVVLAARAYILHVYAPGLRQEVTAVPLLVHDQLVQNGGQYVPLADVSPDVKNAIVAIEDRRFYKHPGIDPQAIVRAVFVNLQAQHVDQGGSTLEEQLAKRVLVHGTDTIHDKLRTMALGWAIDQEFSKRQILEMYLNDAYFGQGAYGIGMAAHTYFGTDPAHVSLSEAAFLAAMPQAPSVYGAHPRAAVVLNRTATVLEDMLNQCYINKAQEQQALSEPLTFALPTP